MTPTKHAATNYRRLLAMIEGDSYRRYDAPGYLRLVLEKLYYSDHKGNPVYSIAHYDEQNGDLMRDPEITFSFDHEAKTVEPLTFQNDFMGYYDEIYKEINGKLCYSRSKRADTDEFLRQWLKNIESQGYTLSASKE